MSGPARVLLTDRPPALGWFRSTPGTDATEGAPEGGAMAGIPSEYAEMLKSNPAAFAALQVRVRVR